MQIEKFYGPARVIEAHGSVTKGLLEKLTVTPNSRILFKTSNSQRGYDRFYSSWDGIESDAAEYLADMRVSLVGIDWLGIKTPDAHDNQAHIALLQRGIPILEGINLAEVDEGEYILSAFPVAYIGIDGAPARAVLIKQ